MPPFFLRALALAVASSFSCPVLVSAQSTPAAPAPVPTASEPAPPVAPPAPVENAQPRRGPAGAQRVEQVEITGKNTGTDERRNSTAAKIVITREDIEQYGDSNLGDVMRRLPGVTSGGRPGRPGPPAMRGMGGGFTQILIDGQRIPPGFSIEQLSPDQVERIEIYRAPTAETGARAIAGTINIILREPLRQTNNDLRLAIASERGLVVPEASWTRNDTFGDNGTYNATLTARTRHQYNDSHNRTTYVDTATGKTTLDDETVSHSEEKGQNLFGNVRWQWRLGNGEQFGVQLLGGHSTSDNKGSTNLTEYTGPGAAYALSQYKFDGNFDFARINLNLNKRLNDTTRYELRGGFGGFQSDTDLRVNQYDAASSLLRLQTTEASVRDRGGAFSGKVVHNTPGDKSHAITAGWDMEGLKRRENSVTLLNGVQQLEDLGTVFDISTRRLAYYVQDEWDPAPNWSANVGLRYEEIQTKSSSAEDGFVNTSRVLTPLAHVVWRFASPRRDQVRLSLTQSYRAPNVGQLTPKPTLSVSYPVPGSNLYTAPDRAGNPMLKPERANGLDLAYEHYLSAGGIMSANLFARQLHDVIRNVTSLEDVSWASSPRYVNRPQNLGDAKTYGIELEAKFRVNELMADAGALGRLSVKMNGSFYTSKVAAIPGPDNRIDGQPAFTGNLGLDYRFTGVPLAIGGNLAWTPSYEVQQTETQRQKLSTRRVFDAYATWNFTPGTRLRFSASNIAPLDSVTQTTNFEGNIRQSTLGVARTYVNYALRLEVRL